MSQTIITPQNYSFLEGKVCGYGEQGIWVREPNGSERFVLLAMHTGVVQVGHAVDLVWTTSPEGHATVVRLENRDTNQSFFDPDLYTPRTQRQSLTLKERLVGAITVIFGGSPFIIRMGWGLPLMNLLLLMLTGLNLFHFGFKKGLKYIFLGFVMLSSVFAYAVMGPFKDSTALFGVLMWFGPPVLAITIMTLGLPEFIRQAWLNADAVDRHFEEAPLIGNLPKGSGTYFLLLGLCAVLGGGAYYQDMKRRVKPVSTLYSQTNEQSTRWEQTRKNQPSAPVVKTPAELEAEKKAREAAAKAEVERQADLYKPVLGTWSGTLSDGRTQQQFVIQIDMEGSLVTIVANDGFTAAHRGRWAYDPKTGRFAIYPKNRQAYDRFTPARGKEHYAYAPYELNGAVTAGTMRLSTGQHTGELSRQ